MSDALCPKNNQEVLEAVAWAAAEETPLEIVGHGTKRALGRPTQTAHTLDLSALSGITLFEPEELVLSAKAATPLKDIQKVLKKHKQEFQFEPADLGPLLGLKAGEGTLGGLINTNYCGARRLKSGSARDHILGIHAVSGRGEEFKSGGRVVKNVTGYDLSKGVTGSYGTLAVLTDITMKVLPVSETEQTLVLIGLSDAEASEAMAKAMGSSAEVSGAAHLPAGVSDEKAMTILRLEGFKPSVEYRIENLGKLLSGFGSEERLDAKASRKLWKSVTDCAPFVGSDNPVWRISCTPTEGHRVGSAIKAKTDVDVFYDWQGGLLWVECKDGEVHASEIRQSVHSNGGGHATLIRASAAQRLETPVFEPQTGGMAALSNRYRENFDPKGILNPGRMV